ncbi:porin [Limnohabitans sp. T6-5]|uniref:porin n=1 Tax=Limnohabitans sp. T6-5 TaxID=1100724 RepID=UPI001304DD42|nr:porin [Limnohabitans sp. T6-5]
MAAAGATFAQSSVTIFGTFDPSIANAQTTYGSGKSVTQNLVRNNSQGTSQVTFTGVEDLGGGLKASFLIENDFDAGKDSSWNAAGGEMYTGLEGSFGSIKLGGANTPSLTAQASRQPFGTKIGSGFGGVLGTKHVRNSNSVVYATPVFSGFSAAIGYAFKTNADTNPAPTIAAVADHTDIGLNYANGPVAAGVSFYSVAKTGADLNSNTQTNAYASYDLGLAKLTLGYVDEKLATGVKQDGFNVAAVVPLSANLSLLGNYAKLDVKESTKDKSIFAIGAKYLLSKRTSVYARYVDEKNDNVTAADSVKGVKTTLVGVQHNF